MISNPFLFNNHPPIFSKSIPSFLISNSLCTFNINALDLDNDSIVFRLDTCLSVNYTLPEGVSIDFITGDFSFINFSNGLYSFLIIIEEWRNGIKINEYPKDFAINLILNTSTEQNSLTNSVIVFPNPVKQTLNILSKNNYTLSTVYDLQGRIIFKQLFEPTFDASNIKNGIYFLELSNKTQKTVQKFIKN